MKVTRLNITASDIKNIVDGNSKPINMDENETPYQFLAHVYNEIALSKMNLINVLEQTIPHIREQAKVDGHAFGTLQLIKKTLGEA